MVGNTMYLMVIRGRNLQVFVIQYKSIYHRSIELLLTYPKNVYKNPLT